MLQQFQQILNSPRVDQGSILQSIRQLLLSNLKHMLPNYYYHQLQQFCRIPQKQDDLTMLIHRLVQYFLHVIQQKFISNDVYSALQMQTQKLQATIRSHIKIQQQVKLYLDHLESRIKKYQIYIHRSINQQIQEPPPSRQDTLLMRERLSLIKRNQQLMRKLKEKDQQLKKYAQNTAIQESFMQKQRLIISKSEKKMTMQQIKTQQSLIHGLKTPIQKQRLQINLSGNYNEFNYYTNK